MGPPPHYRNEQSSESDEESNTRHDRFRSERFQDSTMDDRDKYRDRYSSKRQRERSPLRSHKHRDRNSPQGSIRESRDNYDKKHPSRRYHKYTEADEKERSDYSKKYSKNEGREVTDRCQSDQLGKKKNKLSSILKNFDEKVETKRNALNTNLNKKSDDENEFSHKLESRIGPALPPHLSNVEKVDSDSDISVKETLPAIPPHSQDKAGNNDTQQNVETECSSEQGPELPSHLREQHLLKEDSNETQDMSKDSQDSNHSSTSEALTDNKDTVEIETGSFGPSLPPKVGPGAYGPSLPPKAETGSYGPSLPPNFKKDSIQGPSLPPDGILDQQGESENEDDVVGPLPEGKMNMTQYQLDLRAMEIKRKLEEEKNGSSSEIKKREEWMLELPPEKAGTFGLGPRTFRMREAPDMSNRSSWTDTPADKKRKEEMALRGETEPLPSEEAMSSAFIKERDEAMGKMAAMTQDEHRAVESLLEMHQKKLKKKKKKEEKEGKKPERRPFDRNIDLGQAVRLGDAQKEAVFKKARLLDSRFSSGESKYL